MKNFPQLPMDFSKYVLMEVVLALEDMHKEDTAHRDLKPGNILLTKNFEIKLCDFGEAKCIEDIDREAVRRDFEKFNVDNLSEDEKEAIQATDEELFGSLY